MADAEQQNQLSQEQIDFFINNGWLKLSNCFTKEQADELQSTLWTRLGMDPNDMSTWYISHAHLPALTNIKTDKTKAHRTHQHATLERIPS
jgi:hypothetical protein